MSANNVLISINNLKKHYNGGEVKALDGVTYDINRGEVVVIIGPSGSGKSTLLRCINLLEKPTDGSIIYNGEDILDHKHDIHAYRTKLGMVFQQFNLFNNKTVLENITFAPLILKKYIHVNEKKNTTYKH